METASTDLWAWAILVLLVIDGMIFACGYFLGRAHRQSASAPPPAPAQTTDPAIASALEQGLATLSDQMRSIEARLSKVRSTSQGRQVKDAEGDRLQYAARMAERGNSVEELMAICNLGRGEAELIKLLHDVRGTDEPPGPLTHAAAERN